MNEKRLEWMSVCEESIGHRFGRVAALAAVIILAVWTFMTMSLIFIVLTVVSGGLYYWLQLGRYLEYEYCYFSDDMEIALIYNKARRKKKMSLTLQEVEYVVKGVEKKEITRYFCNQNKVNDLYTLVLNKEGKRTAVVMEPCPEFLEVLQMKRKIR
jgi:hypothetical protein